MAKQLDLDKIYAEFEKEANPKLKFAALEKVQDFVKKSISQSAQEKEDEAAELNELVQKINGN